MFLIAQNATEHYLIRAYLKFKIELAKFTIFKKINFNFIGK